MAPMICEFCTSMHSWDLPRALTLNLQLGQEGGPQRDDTGISDGATTDLQAGIGGGEGHVASY